MNKPYLYYSTPAKPSETRMNSGISEGSFLVSQKDSKNCLMLVDSLFDMLEAN